MMWSLLALYQKHRIVRECEYFVFERQNKIMFSLNYLAGMEKLERRDNFKSCRFHIKGCFDN
jgi:hypothetical protein